MFSKVLVANRGEIALRVIRACRELDVRTVAIYSTADKDALHAEVADEAICIGPPEPGQSYLHILRILSAVEVTGADAVHPGYGFLAENVRFAEICRASAITFIGPAPESIALMGDKARARRLAAEVGVPVIPGSELTVADLREARTVAGQIGYPLLVKASGGGGGRGMRVVEDAAGLEAALSTAQAEAQAAFGDPAVYLERLLPDPRHVEIQVLFDGGGRGVFLGERDCSIQRRHQKLLEEAPSPALTPTLREAMGQAALRLAGAASYANAGTVEFLLDGNGQFFFMEMNTRIQVEHPVTEMVTGLDLVKAQIRIAAGEDLPLRQGEVTLRGHSIECRINAEDPQRFLPSPGTVQRLRWPGGPGVRIDSHLYPGYTVPPFYDSLVAKLITHGQDREEARQRMLRALDELVVEGIQTTAAVHRRVLQDPDFIKGRVSTRFLETLLASA